MTRRTLLWPLLSLVVVFAISTPTTLARDARDRPNFVLIVADDLGYGDVGCYGSEINPTPHIDALARVGVRFTDFHSAGPMCSPTRAAMLTGQYQQRFGERFDGPLSETDDWDHGLPRSAVTFAEVLKTAGYTSACYGKWHLGYQPPWLPPAHGFDDFRGLASGDGDHHTHVSRSGRADWWHNDAIEMQSGYTAELLTGHAVDFMERCHDRPFCLYVPHLAIHFPWQGPDDPPQRQVGINYADDKWGIIPDPGNVSPHVRAMIAAVDRSVGAIVAAIERLQIDQNTVVIFTSDNGGYLTYGDNFRNISSNGPLRDQKGSLYEGGHRVPAIIVWPGMIEPDVSSATAHSTDLLPTLAQLAGADMDAVSSDGVSLAPLLLDKAALPERTLFWRSRRGRAVRHGPWKLYASGGPPELYHLDDDLGEQRDLAAQHPQLVQVLNSRWHAWEDDVNRSAQEIDE